jgi:hypothetical protein
MTPQSAVPRNGKRAYCISCGEVQRDYGNFRHLYGDRITPHLRQVAAVVKAKGQCGEATTSVPCPGGIIDPEGDRAP